jgi:hypothetical protein
MPAVDDDEHCAGHIPDFSDDQRRAGHIPAVTT